MGCSCARVAYSGSNEIGRSIRFANCRGLSNSPGYHCRDPPHSLLMPVNIICNLVSTGQELHQSALDKDGMWNLSHGWQIKSQSPIIIIFLFDFYSISLVVKRRELLGYKLGVWLIYLQYIDDSRKYCTWRRRTRDIIWSLAQRHNNTITRGRSLGSQ